MKTIALTHEFGIIDNHKNLSIYIDYEPKKFNCISVGDNIVSDLMEQLLIMKTYFQTFNRSACGLAYHGTTIIPPESLSLFYSIVISSSYFKKSKELQKLILIITKAIEEEKYMIHFGI